MNDPLSLVDLIRLQHVRDEYLPADVAADFEALLRRAESYLDAGRYANAREMLNQADALLVELEAEDDGRQAGREAWLERVWQRLS